MKLLVLGAAAAAAAAAIALASVVLGSGIEPNAPRSWRTPPETGLTTAMTAFWYDEAGKVIALDRRTRVVAASAGC